MSHAPRGQATPDLLPGVRARVDVILAAINAAADAKEGAARGPAGLPDWTLQQRQAVAGLFGQALACPASHAAYDWNVGFFSDLCRRRLGLQRDTAAGLAPLLGRAPHDELAYAPTVAPNTTPSPIPGDAAPDGRAGSRAAWPGVAATELPTDSSAAATASGWQQHIRSLKLAWPRAESPFLDAAAPDAATRLHMLVRLMVQYINDGQYDARTRDVFRRASHMFGLDWKQVAKFEDALVKKVCHDLQDQRIKKFGRKGMTPTRIALLATAAVTGAALMAATAGLAAPTLAAVATAAGTAMGVGAVTGTIIAFLSTTGGAALVLTLFGLSGGALGSYRMARRLADLKTFEFVSLDGAPPPPPPLAASQAVRSKKRSSIGALGTPSEAGTPRSDDKRADADSDTSAEAAASPSVSASFSKGAAQVMRAAMFWKKEAPLGGAELLDDAPLMSTPSGGADEAAVAADAAASDARTGSTQTEVAALLTTTNAPPSQDAAKAGDEGGTSAALSDAKLVAAGKDAASAVSGGLHVFITVSGLLYDDAPATTFHPDFVEPWGGFGQRSIVDASDEAAREQEDVVAATDALSPTSHRMQHGSGAPPIAAVEDHTPMSVAFSDEVLAAADEAHETKSFEEVSLGDAPARGAESGQYCVLRLPTSRDRAAVERWCAPDRMVLCAGTGLDTAPVLATAVASKSGRRKAAAAAMEAELEAAHSPLGSPGTECAWPAQLFDAAASSQSIREGRVRIISIPLLVDERLRARTPTHATHRLPAAAGGKGTATPLAAGAEGGDTLTVSAPTETRETQIIEDDVPTNIVYLDVGFVACGPICAVRRSADTAAVKAAAGGAAAASAPSPHSDVVAALPAPVVVSSDDPADEYTASIHVVLASERFRGYGIGEDALRVFLSDVLIDLFATIDTSRFSFLFTAPAEATGAVYAAQACGFSSSGMVQVGSRKFIRCVGTPAKVAAAVNSEKPTTDSSTNSGGAASGCGGSGSAGAPSASAGWKMSFNARGGNGSQSQSAATPATSSAALPPGLKVLFRATEADMRAARVRASDGTFVGDASSSAEDVAAGSGGALVSSDSDAVSSARKVEPLAVLSAVVPTFEVVGSKLTSAWQQSRRVGVLSVSRVKPKHSLWFKRACTYGDLYALVYEPAVLKTLGMQLTNFVRASVTNKLVSEVLSKTLLATLFTAVALPSAVADLLSFIDTPWALAIDRSDKAGEALAKALLDGAHGHRPVTLVGYGMGARVIFAALSHIARAAAEADAAYEAAVKAAGGSLADTSSLSSDMLRRSPRAFDATVYSTRGSAAAAAAVSASKRKASLTACNPYGIVHDAILLGAPVTASEKEWQRIRQVVSGRCVNGYCTGDVVLRYVYRGAALSWKVAGVAPVGGTACRYVPATTGAARAGSSAHSDARGDAGDASLRSGYASPVAHQMPSVNPWDEFRTAASDVAFDAKRAVQLASASITQPFTPMQREESASSDAPSGTVNGATGSGASLPHTPAPTLWYHGIENVDLSHLVRGHLDYRGKLPKLLQHIDFEMPV